MTDLGFRTGTQLTAAIRRKEVGSLELLDYFLDRIERLNPKVNAVVTLDTDRARAAAQAADNDLVHGGPRGSLHGLPITVKDSIETAGLRTTAGATDLAGHVPERDADAVARLRAAGAVVFGKTNLPPYTMDYQSYNELFGTTNNPWDPARGPGGSSGGAAAALAAGLTGMELGSDMGGSIRVPAHFCGVCGLKPSYGIVPARGHIPGPSGSLASPDMAVLGPMGRSVQDLALGLGVLAGPDDWQAPAWRLELPPPRQASLGDYRIGAWLDDPSAEVASEVRTALESASQALRRAGAKIDDTARPAISFSEAYDLVAWILMGAAGPFATDEEFEEVCRMAAQPVQEDEPALMRRTRQLAQRHREWLTYAERRAQQRARWAEFFGDHDVLLCPVTCTAAFLHDHSDPMTRVLEINGNTRDYVSANEAWCTIIGVAYLPSVVVPVGKTEAGLPVGIQIVGPYLEDRTALDVAAAIEAVLGGFEAPPGY